MKPIIFFTISLFILSCGNNSTYNDAGEENELSDSAKTILMMERIRDRYKGATDKQVRIDLLDNFSFNWYVDSSFIVEDSLYYEAVLKFKDKRLELCKLILDTTSLGIESYLKFGELTKSDMAIITLSSIGIPSYREMFNTQICLVHAEVHMPEGLLYDMDNELRNKCYKAFREYFSEQAGEYYHYLSDEALNFLYKEDLDTLPYKPVEIGFKNYRIASEFIKIISSRHSADYCKDWRLKPDHLENILENMQLVHDGYQWYTTCSQLPCEYVGKITNGKDTIDIAINSAGYAITRIDTLEYYFMQMKESDKFMFNCGVQDE